MRKYIFTAMLMAMTLSLTACPPKNQDNNNGAQAPCIGASCVGALGPNGGVTLATGLGSYYFNNQKAMELSLNFYGAAGTGAANNSNVASQPQSYSGEVMAVGELSTTGLIGNVCNIPVGRFALVTTRNGYWQGTIFQGLQLQAQGVNVSVYLANDFITASSPAAVDLLGRTFPFRVQGWVYLQVNGQPCGSMLLE